MTKVGDPDWDALIASDDFNALHSPLTSEPFQTLAESKQQSPMPLPTPFTPLNTEGVGAPIHKQGWQSSNVSKRRYFLAICTIAITGSLLAIGGFIAFLKIVGNKQDPKPIVQANPITTTVAKDPVEALPPKEPLRSESEPTEDANKTTDGQSFPPENSVPAMTQEPSNSAEMPPETPSTMLDKPQADTPVEPPLPTPRPQTADVNDQGNNDALPLFFREFERDFLGGGKSISDAGIGDMEVTNEIELPEEEVSQSMHPQPQKVPSWDEKSKLTIASFKMEKTNLLRCIDMFSKLTSVGISLDWQSCRVAGIDWNKKIELHQEGKTVHELITQIVAENLLQWSVDEQGLPVISASQEAMNAHLPTDWSLEGLFPEGSEQAACDSLLKLWNVDPVCRFVDNRLEWLEQATPLDKSNVLSSIYTIAASRRLGGEHRWHRPANPISSFDPVDWFQIASSVDRKIRMAAIVPEARPITDILMTAAAETQVNLIVDWKNVWKNGLVPTQKEVSLLRGRTFPEVARRYLEDYELELIPITADTFLLTTREERRRLIRVISVQLPKNAKEGDLKQALQFLAPLPEDSTRFKVLPIPGSKDLFYARICTPPIGQLNDPDIVYGLGWNSDN